MLFNLKFASKEMLRESKKCEKAEKEEKNKLKKVSFVLWYLYAFKNLFWENKMTNKLFHCVLQAIAQGKMEAAKIHAENAIRKKNESLNYHRMSTRIDAVASRVQTACTMNKVIFQ